MAPLDASIVAEEGDLLSMVPPTIEALMDIMEGSRDLTELLDNEVAPDVVDQTRGLVEQVIQKVTYLPPLCISIFCCSQPASHLQRA